MKGSFRFGTPGHRRYSMQYGYDARPRLWQRVKANAHFIIAGAGTASLLGIAGIGLWLAMPVTDRQAFAEAANEGNHTKPVVVADAEPIAANIAQLVLKQSSTPTQPPGADNPPTQQSTNTTMDSASGSAGALVASQERSQELKQAFASTKIDPIAAAAIAVTREATGGNLNGQDLSQTAAIPTPRPEINDADVNEGGDPGHILKAVNMRAGPKKGATILTTIPAKTEVTVMSCESWCEVVYEGKRGWVYNSYVKKDG